MIKIESSIFATSWQSTSLSSHPLQCSLSKICLFLILMLVLGSLTPLHGQVHGLTPIGGSGGSPFADMCPNGAFLTGFALHTGDDVDAIQQLCLGTDDRRNFDTQWHGGNGGNPTVLLCPAQTPAVVALYVRAEGQDTVIVNNIHLFCGFAANGQRLISYPDVVFDGPPFHHSGFVAAPVEKREDCPAGQIALGVTGSSGVWLDAIGIICGPPPIPPTPAPPPPDPRNPANNPAKSIGRVKVDGASTPSPTRSLCESAASARARNSPAAPTLEAQCNQLNAQIAAAEKIDLAPGPSGVPTSICDAAQAAINRMAIDAADLIAKCNATGDGRKLISLPDQLAATGASLIAADPLLATFEQRQPAGEVRRGFDIGVGATGSDTLWGPGKQRIVDSLPPSEQEGFKLASSYLLDRNRYLALSAVGAKIAALDVLVQRTRTIDPDIRYWLGFDIASALYGDPKLGSQGSRSTGPGSAKILASLSIPAQRGFTASTQFHLARTY